jgi:hypothetical protein
MTQKPCRWENIAGQRTCEREKSLQRRHIRSQYSGGGQHYYSSIRRTADHSGSGRHFNGSSYNTDMTNRSISISQKERHAVLPKSYNIQLCLATCRHCHLGHVYDTWPRRIDKSTVVVRKHSDDLGPIGKRNRAADSPNHRRFRELDENRETIGRQKEIIILFIWIAS